MTDDEEKQVKRELLAVDLKLRRKQEFWETPRNVAILVGVTAAIAAAIGYWLGRASAPSRMPPGFSPVGAAVFGNMSPATFIDAVETAGIIVIAAMLVYVVVRLDRTLTGAAEKIQGALTTQSGLMQSLERNWKRLEAIEHLVWERNEIMPAAEIEKTLDAIRERITRLEGDKRE